jgi:hypothetical protein
MHFFLLLLFNIFMGAVLYLIISLKLERSATEFRERKLRKEMDEIIREFNATADRNISILENRIMVMKRLLEKSGDKRTLDVVIDDAELPGKYSTAPGYAGTRTEADEISAIDITGKPDGIDGGGGSKRIAKKGLPLIIKKLIHKRPSDKIKIEGNDDTKDPVRKDKAALEYAETISEVKTDPGEQPAMLVKDLRRVVTASGDESAGRTPLSEEEIVQIVSQGKDKYSLVSVLHDKGCTVEDISQYSGIPIGEVRLVLNLGSSR